MYISVGIYQLRFQKVMLHFQKNFLCSLFIKWHHQFIIFFLRQMNFILVNQKKNFIHFPMANRKNKNNTKRQLYIFNAIS